MDLSTLRTKDYKIEPVVIYRNELSTKNLLDDYNNKENGRHDAYGVINIHNGMIEFSTDQLPYAIKALSELQKDLEQVYKDFISDDDSPKELLN